MNKLFLCGTQYHVLEAVAACLKESCRAEIGFRQHSRAASPGGPAAGQRAV